MERRGEWLPHMELPEVVHRIVLVSSSDIQDTVALARGLDALFSEEPPHAAALCKEGFSEQHGLDYENTLLVLNRVPDIPVDLPVSGETGMLSRSAHALKYYRERFEEFHRPQSSVLSKPGKGFFEDPDRSLVCGYDQDIANTYVAPGYSSYIFYSERKGVDEVFKAVVKAVGDGQRQ